MVQNLLIGNGVNIQHGGYDFTNAGIILRTLKNFKDPNFPKHIITDDPIDAKCYIGYLFMEIPSILSGQYDEIANCTAERNSLAEFKSKYTNKSTLKITDIGFEDYYLIHDLLCRRTGVINPEQYDIRESIKSCFLHAIYDNGKVNSLSTKYSDEFTKWLCSFDNILTTNYDVNIENATGKQVVHVHGDFITRAAVYNPNSFRNQISDKPIDNCVIDENYSHLYATAISTHCGDYKQYTMKEGMLANSALEKFAIAYNDNPTVRDDINSWENDRNDLVSRLGESVRLKVQNPQLKFDELYPVEEIESMNGELTILGLSPYNDRHLFEIINASEIVSCKFYFYDESECKVIESLLSNKEVTCEDAKQFWIKYGSKSSKGKLYKNKNKKITFKNVSHFDFHKFADAYRGLSGSIMSDTLIVQQFNKTPYSTRVGVCNHIKELEVERSKNTEQQFVLSIVDINIIATEFDIDPAVVCCIGADKCKNEFIRLV